MADAERLSLNTATLREQCSLEQMIELCARHRVRAIAPWRDQLAACGLDKAITLIRAAGLDVSSVCRGGMFSAADADGRRRALDDNRRAIDEAAALNARALVLVVGGLAPASKDIDDARAQVRDGIAASLEYARAAGVALAIEPLHPMYAADRACVNTLAQALDLCDELGANANGHDGRADLGVVVDVYHTWWDPQLHTQIERAGRRRLLGFHVCDWLVPTTDLLLDRGMMGDGVIDIPRIRGWMEQQRYDDFIEVEIFSRDNWWQRDPDEVLTICRERFADAV